MTIKDPAIPDRFLNKLNQASMFDLRYEMDNDSSVLDDAISIWEQIMDDPSFPQTASDFQVACLNDGGTSFLNRFHARGSVEDLDRALNWWENATRLVQAPDADLLGNIGRVYFEKFQLNTDVDALQSAHNYCCDAKEAAPNDPATCSTLGLVLMDMHNVTGDAQQLSDALESFECGLKAFSSLDLRNEVKREHYSSLLNNRGMALATMLSFTPDVKLGEEAKKCFQEAIKLSPKSPHTPVRKSNLLSIERDLNVIRKAD